jgi:hypothetical protein
MTLELCFPGSPTRGRSPIRFQASRPRPDQLLDWHRSKFPASVVPRQLQQNRLELRGDGLSCDLRDLLNFKQATRLTAVAHFAFSPHNPARQ